MLFIDVALFASARPGGLVWYCFAAEFKHLISTNVPAYSVLCFKLCPMAAGFSRHCMRFRCWKLLLQPNKPQLFIATLWLSFSSEDDVQRSVANSESCAFADAQALGPHTSPILGIGWSVPSHSSSLAASSQSGRPASVVASFVAALVPPGPSLVSFGINVSLASALPFFFDSTSLLSAPMMYQSFVIWSGNSPIPTKLVNQIAIVSGKYVDFFDLLSLNPAYVEPKPQITLRWPRGFIRRSEGN